MNIKRKFSITLLAISGLFLYAGCEDDYDPIGNNKPATKLQISPRNIAFDGAGGTLSVSVNTNAPDINLEDMPEWVEGATFDEEKSKLTIVVKENQVSDQVRTGGILLKTVTGENESSVRLNMVQAGKSGTIGFDSFEGNTLGDNWTATNNAAIKLGMGQVTVSGVPNGIGNSLYYLNQKGLITQHWGGAGNMVTGYVDVKAGPGVEGGLKVYYDPSSGDEFKFFFTMNNDINGAFFAFRRTMGNDNPMALGDAIPGAGMPAVPPLGERDEYMRIEFTNVTTAPFWWQSEVNIYSLQTRNGVTKILNKHFSRKFEIDMPKPDPGYFGLWGRYGEVVFRNFTLSAKQN